MLTPRPNYIPTYLPGCKGTPKEKGKDIPKVEEPTPKRTKLWVN